MVTKGIKDMAKCKFELNEMGLRKFAQSPEMLRLTEEYAEKTHPGKARRSFIGFDRAKTIVYDRDYKGGATKSENK